MDLAKHKLVRYIKQYAEECTISDRSLYFKFTDKLSIRVSDHYATSSTGTYSIIVPVNNAKCDMYVLVRKCMGTSKICTYDEVKAFIKMIQFTKEFVPEITTMVEPANGTGILKLEDLTPKQLGQVKNWLKQRNSKTP